MKYSHLDVVGINEVTLVSNDKQPKLLMQLCIFVGQLLYYTFIKHFRYKKLPEHYKGIVFLGVSLNNQRSLDPIADHLNDDEYIYLKDHKSDINKRRAMWRCIPYLPALLKTYRKSDTATKKAIKKYFTRMWVTYGYYQLALEYLHYYQVKTLVVSSDHGEFHRCLMLRANDLGIKTIYVQHASVAKGFPKLIASYSFLDGRESFDKYLFSGIPEGDVYLSGGVRFDPSFNKYPRRDIKSVTTIGIAINMLDDFEKIKTLCIFLLEQGYRLILRPHPRYGALDTTWLSDNGIGYSDPKKETSFDFISKIDLMVSNESSIHLDSAMMRCPSIAYNFSNNPILDFYSYIKTGLIKVADSESELIHWIQHPNEALPNFQTLQFFNASCGTQFEGTLGQSLAKFILDIAQTEEDSAKIIVSGFKQNSEEASFSLYTIS